LFSPDPKNQNVTFVPRAKVLTLEEMARLARVLVQLGVKRIRLTGGGASGAP